MLPIKEQKAIMTLTIITREVPHYPWQIVASDLFSVQEHVYVLIANSYSGFYDFKKLSNNSPGRMVLNTWNS